MNIEEEDGLDYSVSGAFRKKYSLPNKPTVQKRANSIVNDVPSGVAPPRNLVTAEPGSRAAIRFKKVGNLATIEKQFKGARMSTLNSSGEFNAPAGVK